MRRLGLLIGLMAFGVPSVVSAHVTFQINYLDGASEGFNDPTAATPIPSVPPNNGTTIGEQRRIAFEYALSIWAPYLESTVPIAIDAYFDPLTCDASSAILGSAGALTVHREFTNAPRANTWYSQSLANSLAGTDLSRPEEGGTSDLRARFNSSLGTICPDFEWYYGLDLNHGTAINLVSVLLHEFAHGFGFQTFASFTLHPLSGSWFNGFPDAYGHFVYDNEALKNWDAMTEAERGASMINSRAVAWTGRLVNASVGMLEMGIPGVRVTAPAGVVGFYDAGEAEFGPDLSTPVTGLVILGQDGTQPKSDGCEALTNSVDGKIVLLDRGNCIFTQKVLNAQAAGAIGVLIADNVANEPPAGLAGDDPAGDILIPSVRVSQATGTLFKTTPPTNATLLRDGSRRAGTDTAGRMLLWSPNPYESGSSISHFDVIARPNLIMEPYSNDDEQHSPDLTLPLLRDTGWACPTPALDAVAFTARLTSATAKLEWRNAASGGFASPPPLRYRTDGTTPMGPTDGAAVACPTFNGSAGAYNSCAHSGLTNGTTYSYRLFSTDDVCYSPGVPRLTGAPRDTTGKFKWAFVTGAASLATPGLLPAGTYGPGVVFSVSNDRLLHGMNPGAAGGDWPRTAPYSWAPFAMNGPVPRRPVVLPLTAGPRVMIASSDGHVYLVDAHTGLTALDSGVIAEGFGASPAGFFSDFVSGAPDLILAGTRNTTAANKLVALSPTNLSQVTARTFTNAAGTQNGDGQAIGIITGVAVSYGDWRVFFTSYARSGGSPGTVWGLDASDPAVTRRLWVRTDLGNIDAAPVAYAGKVYVGSNNGWVYALDAATGTTVGSWNTGTGQPIKGYVTPDYGASPLRLYVATSSAIHALDEGGAAPAWSMTGLNSPSVPLLVLGTTNLYYGDGAGALHQVNTTTHTDVSSISLGASALGAPAYDYVNSMVHVGSEAGVVYAVSVPL